MIYKHKRSGKLYRHLGFTFDVATQKEHCLYIQLETGYVFNREEAIFYENFELVDGNPHSKIVPKEK